MIDAERDSARAVLALLPLLRGQEPGAKAPVLVAGRVVRRCELRWSEAEDALLLGAGQNPLRGFADHPLVQAWIEGPVQRQIRDAHLARAVVMEGALVRIRRDGTFLCDALGGPTPAVGHPLHRRLLRALLAREIPDGAAWQAGPAVPAHVRLAQAALAGSEETARLFGLTAEESQDRRLHLTRQNGLALLHRIPARSGRPQILSLCRIP